MTKNTSQPTIRSTVLFPLLIVAGTALADCPLAHTHIGINPTWRPVDWTNPEVAALDPDPTDNNQLWLFSLPPVHPSATPGWPAWQQVDGGTFLLLSPVLDQGQSIVKPDGAGKVLYTCSFMYSKLAGYGDEHGLQHLDGWHSAYGPQGAWNLQGTDANTVPPWDLFIQRVRTSDNLEADDFFGLLPDDSPALEADGDTLVLTTRWLSDENAWGLHEHMGFYFWLDAADEDVSVTLAVHDAAGLYRRSADTVFRFARQVCVPVPGDLNGDCVVDIHDLQIVIEHFAISGLVQGQDMYHDHDHDHDHEE